MSSYDSDRTYAQLDEACSMIFDSSKVSVLTILLTVTFSELTDGCVI